MIKPKVTIALAMYRPNLNLLEELLVSLNNQDYDNLDLLVWNDCPDDRFDYNSLFEKRITNFDYRIVQSQENLRTGAAFSWLTQHARGEYVAFCDQDDVWFSNKISVLVEFLQKNNKDVVIANMDVIDGDGVVIGDKFLDDLQIFCNISDDEVLMQCLYNPRAYGCTMLFKKSILEGYLPFPAKYGHHDTWVAIVGAINGKLSVYDKPVLHYRRHGGNQSCIFGGITSKGKYIDLLHDHKLMGDTLMIRVKDMDDCTKKMILMNFSKYVIAKYNHHVSYSFKDLFVILGCPYCSMKGKLTATFWPIMPESFLMFVIGSFRKFYRVFGYG